MSGSPSPPAVAPALPFPPKDLGTVALWLRCWKGPLTGVPTHIGRISPASVAAAANQGGVAAELGPAAVDRWHGCEAAAEAGQHRFYDRVVVQLRSAFSSSGSRAILRAIRRASSAVASSRASMAAHAIAAWQFLWPTDYRGELVLMQLARIGACAICPIAHLPAAMPFDTTPGPARTFETGYPKRLVM